MKNKLKNYLKLGIFLFGISLLLVNCEKDNFNNNIDSHQIAEINYKNLDELPEIAAALSDINAFGKTNGSTSSKTMNTDFGNLSISNILEYVNNDGKETYTFKIEKEIDSLNIFSFENLHLVKVDEDYLAYILKWEPNNEWYESNNYIFVTQYFTGIQKHYDLDYNLLQETEFINGQPVNTSSSSNKNSTTQNSKMDYLLDCNGELGSLCNGVPWDCGGDICGWGFSTYCFNINVGGGNNDDTSSGGNPSGGGTRIPRDNDTSSDLVDGGDATVVVIPPEISNDDCDTSKEDLKKIFPNLSTANASTLAHVINNKGKDFGIDTKERLWHFLSQAGHETGGFNTLQVTENMNYSTASLIPKSYPSKFTMDTVANPTKKYAGNYTSNSSGLANVAMCCKYGNGNEASGDGYKYRGRGIFQLTWKDNYTSFKTWYNNKYDPDKDFVTSPDLISSNDTLAILSGLWYYKTRVLDKITVDSTATVDKVTVKINGKAKKGLKDRKAIFTKAKDSITCK